MKAIFSKFVYVISVIISTLIVLAIALFISIYYFTAYLQHHPRTVQAWVSTILHQPIEVDGMEVKLIKFDPVIGFKNVVIFDTSIAKLNIRIDLIHSLLQHELKPKLLIVSGMKLVINDVSGQEELSHNMQRLVKWLSLQHAIYLNNVILDWSDKTGRNLIFVILHNHIINHLSDHTVLGNGYLLLPVQHSISVPQFNFMLHLKGDLLKPQAEKIDGNLNFNNLPIQKIFAGLKGNIDFQSSFICNNEKIEQITGKFFLHDYDDKKLAIQNLTGNILVTPEQDGWLINGSYEDFLFNYQHMFRQNLLLKMINADLKLYKENNSWHVDANNIYATNDDIILKDGSVTIDPRFCEDDKDLHANIKAGFVVRNIANAYRYYPVTIMPKELVAWLDKSIVGGKGASGTFELVGNLPDFPFTKKNGKFLINSKLDAVDLDFDSAWPKLNNINGDLIVDKAAMHIKVSGDMLHKKINNIDAEFPDLTTGILNITGDVAGENKDLIDFLKESPLQNVIKNTQQIEFSGPMNLDLKLHIPLTNIDALAVKGKISEQQGLLTIPQWKISVADIIGDIYFTQDSLSANLNSKLFSEPAFINISSSKGQGKNFVAKINVASKVNMGNLRKIFSYSPLQYLDGDFAYQGVLSIYPYDLRATNFALVSDLKGLAVHLPQPFAKVANFARKFYLNINAGISKRLRAIFVYGDDIHGVMDFANDSGNLNFFSGNLNFGKNAALLQTEPGLLISGFLPKFDWPKWHDFVTKKNSGPKLLRKIDIIIGDLPIFSQDFKNIKFLLNAKQDFWDASIKNDNIEGNIMVPYNFPQQEATAEFTKLKITTSKKPQEIDPKTIPPLHIKADNFAFDDKTFAKLELRMEPIEFGVQLSKIFLSCVDFNLSGSGKWEDKEGKSNSVLYGTLRSNDFGELLRKSSHAKNLVGGNGSIIFTLRWPGILYKPVLEHLDGNLLVNVKNGSIIHLGKKTEEAIGIGKVLNIFSLQALPRRLTLNFTDLTKKGFVFDTLAGGFSLVDSNAYTDNTELKGIVADIKIQGRIGLFARDCDLLLTMMPNVTSSLPVLVALVGGPVAGAATWVADTLFQQTLQKATAYIYKVTGLWGNPQVIRLVRHKNV